MLFIKTSVMGRQKLLNNLYVRNYLYGKHLTIEVSIEDKLHEDGTLDEKYPLVMHIDAGYNHDMECFIDDKAVEYIKAAIEEQNKYNPSFEL